MQAALTQSFQHCRRQHIAGGVIQRLHLQRCWFGAAAPRHSLMRNAATHLHQAVEPTAVAPRAAPTLGIQADIHQARCELLTGGGIQSELLQRVGAIAVHQHIRLTEQNTQLCQSGSVF